MSCVGTPISHLRLEARALGQLSGSESAAIDEHLASCAGCRKVVEHIDADEVSLPPLPDAEPRWSWSWLWVAVPTAAALLLLLLFGRDWRTDAEDGLGVKGGSNGVALVRESGGVLLDPTRFAPGDRFKVLVTCPPGRDVDVDVVVYQKDEVSFPIEPQRIACGNEVALDGAFRLTGGAADVCAVLGVAAGDREALRDRQAVDDSLCRTVTPAR